MRIAILGAGPSGLYLAYLLKRANFAADIEVYEQNPQDATFGFGVAFSERALEFLDAEDAGTHAAMKPALEYWNDSILYLNGSAVRIDGMGYAGIGRLALLRILQAQAQSVGIAPHYRRAVADLRELGDADLIIGADGANSLVRRTHEQAFGTTVKLLKNRFAWYGTTKRFEALSHTFVETPLGTFNAHIHRHAPNMSTFVVEMDQDTFLRNGFDKMPLPEAQALCTEVFADTLQGHTLISNNSIWRQFPRIATERWSVGNCVLLGDALHTAHFSIGSGTRLAMEDAIALAKALIASPKDLPQALHDYEAQRKPIMVKLLNAANTSSDWYEEFPQHMRLSPIEFAYSYITRSGRVDLDRLRRSSPDFMAAYEAQRARA